jgi:hypothetical protein
MKFQLHSTNYDAQLKAALKHLVSYPQMLPFIGHAWDSHTDRILLIAESHYLPVGRTCDSQTWYDGDASLLSKDEKDWTDTRGVIRVADDYSIYKEHHAKGHSIFYNMKSAIFAARQISKHDQRVFQNFGYYNYFQRPAEKSGKSIITSGNDYRVAYETLKAIAQIAKPTALVFVSKKAHTSFCHWRRQENDGIFDAIPSYSVPHPASAWWNKPSNAHGGITGKAKFINIIKKLDLQLAEAV